MRYRISKIENEKVLTEKGNYFDITAIDDATAQKTASECAVKQMHWPKKTQIVIEQISIEAESKIYTLDEIKKNMIDVRENMVTSFRENLIAINMIQENNDNLGR